MSEGGLDSSSDLDSSSEAAGQGFSRRRLMMAAAKGGTAVAAAAWVAPHLESVAFAAGSQGSPCPNPDNPSCGTTTSSSTPTTRGNGVTCGVDPGNVEQGNRVRFFGTGWKASSRVKIMLVGQREIGQITVHPDGTYSRRYEIVRSVPPGTYRVEVVGFNAEGRAVRCFNTLVVRHRIGVENGSTTATTSGSGQVGSATGSNSGRGSASAGSASAAQAGSASGSASHSASGSHDPGGTLPFTGSDPGALAALGVGAVVVGRVLYGLRDRIARPDGDATAR